MFFCAACMSWAKDAAHETDRVCKQSHEYCCACSAHWVSHCCAGTAFSRRCMRPMATTPARPGHTSSPVSLPPPSLVRRDSNLPSFNNLFTPATLITASIPSNPYGHRDAAVTNASTACRRLSTYRSEPGTNLKMWHVVTCPQGRLPVPLLAPCAGNARAAARLRCLCPARGTAAEQYAAYPAVIPGYPTGLRAARPAQAAPPRATRSRCCPRCTSRRGRSTCRAWRTPPCFRSRPASPTGGSRAPRAPAACAVRAPP